MHQQKYLLIAALLTTALGLPARGQGPTVSPGATGPQSAPTTRTLLISPQRPEKPDLRYQLLPRARDTRPGNAAVKYLEAAMQLTPLSNEENAAVEAARTSPFANLNPADERLQRLLSQNEVALRILREARLLESADWETDIRERGFDALLPSIAQMRQLSNLLSLQIRFHIKRHDWAAAHERLQAGYVLARHLGTGVTLVESLVGVSIANQMNDLLQDWIAEPGSPNLYWPLTNLPSPFIDMRRALSFERDVAYFGLPQLREFRQGRYSAEGWSLLVQQFSRVGAVVGPNESLMAPLAEPWKQQLVSALGGMALYPEAKRFLLEHGHTAEAVQAMPVPEALGRYFIDSLEEAWDDMYKWLGLPPNQALPALRAWEKTFSQEKARNRVNLLAAVLLPSLHRAIENRLRLDRHIGALRLVEAVRAHAAENSAPPAPPGLPARLEDLTLPRPTDPLGTGYDFRREADTLIIEAKSDRPRDTLRFEIRLRP